MESTTASSHIN